LLLAEPEPDEDEELERLLEDELEELDDE